MIKKYILVILLFTSLYCFGQKDFEGYILYRGTERFDAYGSEELDTAERTDQSIKVYFSPGMLRVESSKERKGGVDIGIIRLDSGLTYTLYPGDKTYSVEPLKRKSMIPAGSRERIQGFSATPLAAECFLPPMMEGKAMLWYADSLFFTVPTIYEENDELIMVSHNRVLLKAIIYMRGYADASGELYESARLEAAEIIPAKNSPGLFSVPAGYTKENLEIYESDTAMIMVDTAEIQQAFYPEKLPQASSTARTGKAVFKKKKQENFMRKPADNH